MGRQTTARYERLREECAARGLRLTPQRDALLRVLGSTTGHPTADDLVQRVRQMLPSISHATVYRNVQELVGAGLVGTLERAGGAVQYEVNPDDHHHMVCRECGRVWDVYLNDIGFRVDRRRSRHQGFRVERSELQLHGVCQRCQ